MSSSGRPLPRRVLILYKMRSLFTIFVGTTLSIISFAQEAAAPGAAGAKPPVNSFLVNAPMILLFVALFYFLILAPQKKQQKQQVDFQKSLAKGDEVVTASGIIGRVAGLTERVATIEVAPGTEIRFLRSQIQARLKELKSGEVVA